MKKIILVCLGLLFIGCGTNQDGSSKSTYSSCKITSSSAILASDRVEDLQQCWNASGDGYESKSDALAWCESKVINYRSSKYIIEPNMQFVVESTNCP